MEPDFGRYTDTVNAIKEFVSVDNPLTIACKCSFAADVNKDPKKWTKKDLTNLATNKFGCVYFNDLSLLVQYAVQKNVQGTDYTPDAKNAQAALREFMPETEFLGKGAQQPMKLSSFMKLILTVDEETATDKDRVKWLKDWETRKADFKKGKKTAMLTSDITEQLDAKLDEKVLKTFGLATKEAPTFDQQKALSTLTANNVKLSSDQSLKTPEVDRALEFVKAAKGRAA